MARKSAEPKADKAVFWWTVAGVVTAIVFVACLEFLVYHPRFAPTSCFNHGRTAGGFVCQWDWDRVFGH